MKEKEIYNKNTGINLLKIYAIFCVLILHCLGHGGILQNAVVNSTQYKFSWFIEIIAYPAVNLFALISGYVYFNNSKVKNILSNVLKLWIIIVFYGLLFTLAFDIFSKQPITYKDYLMNLFPITNNLYWYFTAYAGLAIIMPLITKGLENIDKKTSMRIFWIIILFFSVFDRVVNQYFLNNGYSFIWITLLFILGAIIRKNDIGKKIKSPIAIISILLLFIITYLYKIYGFVFNINTIAITKDLLVNYTSITILLSSILLLILFSRININKKISKVINYITPSVFFVYIINENRFIRDDIIVNLFSKYANSSILKILVYIVLFSIAFLILSIIVDKIRSFIFDKLKINTIIGKISNHLL